MHVIRIFVVVLLAILIASPAGAVVVTLTPTQDTSVSSGTPGSSYGNETEMVVGEFSGTWNGYIQWDIAGSIPAGATINSVSLRVRQDGSPQTISTVSFRIQRINSFWSESTTWNNRPSTTGTSILAFMPGSTTDQWRTFNDVSNVMRNYVQNVVDGTTDRGLALLAIPETGIFCRINSSETSLEPELIIDYGAPTPPDIRIDDIVLTGGDTCSSSNIRVDYCNIGADADDLEFTYYVNGVEIADDSDSFLGDGDCDDEQTNHQFTSAGSVQITVTVAPVAGETNTSNNSRTEMFTITGRSDLVVTDIWTDPAVPIAGDPVTLWATVRNTGTVATGATCNLDFFFNQASCPPDGATEGYRTSFQSVNAGQSRDVFRNTVAPAGGTYTIYAKADSTNIISSECSNTNNCGSESLMIATGNPVFGSQDCEVAPPVVEQGETIAAIVYVNNPASTARSVRYAVDFDHTGAGATLSPPPVTVSVPGNTNNFFIQIIADLPENVAAGDYDVIYTITSPDGSVLYDTKTERDLEVLPRPPAGSTLIVTVQEHGGSCISGTELTGVQLLRNGAPLGAPVDPAGCTVAFEDLEAGDGYALRVWATDMLAFSGPVSSLSEGSNTRQLTLPIRATLDGRVVLTNNYTPDPGATVRLVSQTGAIWREGTSTGDGGMLWGGTEDVVTVFAATQPGESWRIEAIDRFGSDFTSTILTEMQEGTTITGLNVQTREVTPGLTVLLHGLKLTGEGGWLEDFEPIDDYWEVRFDWMPGQAEFQETDHNESNPTPEQSRVIRPLLKSFGGGNVYRFDRSTNSLDQDLRFTHPAWIDAGLYPGSHAIVVHDWARQSNDDFRPGAAEAAADALLAALFHPDSDYRLDPLSPESAPGIQLIGHSRGTSVASELAQRLTALGFQVDSVTYLDAHEFDEDDVFNSLIDADFEFGDSTDGSYNDPAVQFWEGVHAAENYWQSVGGAPNSVGIWIPNPSGHPHGLIGGPDHPDISLDGKTGFVTPHSPSPRGHGLVVDWYFKTLGRDESVPADWYNHELDEIGSGMSAWLARGGFDWNPAPVVGRVDPTTFENLIPFPGDDSYPGVGPDFDDSFAAPLFMTGDFELEGLAEGQMGGIFQGDNGIAGWSHYGGGGTAPVVQYDANGDGAYEQSYLLLRPFSVSDSRHQRTHNYQLVPPDAEYLSFQWAVQSQVSGLSTLIVEFLPADGPSVVLTEIPFAELSGFLRKSVPVDGSNGASDLRGQVGRLQFTLDTNIIYTEVWIDDIEWSIEPQASVAIAVDADEYQVVQGETLSIPISILRENFDQAVTLSVDACLPGATCAFEPSGGVLGDAATLIISGTEATPVSNQPYDITISGMAAGGGVSVSSMAVQVTVVPAPQPMIVVAPATVDFGAVPVPYCGEFEAPTLMVAIENAGDAPLVVDEWIIENVEVFQDGQWVTASGEVFETLTDNLPGPAGDVIVSPGDTESITVSFDPPFRRMYRADLVISSDDPKQPLVAVDLLGVAITGDPCEPESPSPADLSADVDTDIGALCWDAGAGASSTRIVLSLSPDLASPILDITTSEQCVDIPHLAEESTHYWQATSINSAGSVPGPVWSFGTVGERCLGDINDDGMINMNDLNLLLEDYYEEGDDLAADINEDGIVEFADLVQLLFVYGQTCN